MTYPGVRLVDMYRGVYTPREISVYVKYLPRGCPLWEAIGGRDAITSEVEELWVVQHLLVNRLHQAGGGQGTPPKAREYPKGWQEQQAAVAHTLSQAEAFRRKHSKTE
jgi:hypothetical protein